MSAEVPTPEVTTEQVAAALAGGATLVDVREPFEYEAGHVPQAKSIPLGEILDRKSELSAESTVYVICAVGGRSLHAAGALREAGYDAVSVAGGTNAWASEGRPISLGA